MIVVFEFVRLCLIAGFVIAGYHGFQSRWRSRRDRDPDARLRRVGGAMIMIFCSMCAAVTLMVGRGF